MENDQKIHWNGTMGYPKNSDKPNWRFFQVCDLCPVGKDGLDDMKVVGCSTDQKKWHLRQFRVFLESHSLWQSKPVICQWINHLVTNDFSMLCHILP